MKNGLLKSIIISFTILVIGCSKDNPPKEPVVVNLPLVVINPLTKQNVKRYMVDKNATAETVALFYNLKK